jgi:hypothetical protein
MRRALVDDERGQVAWFFVLLLPVIFMFFALAFDVGLWMLDHRLAQNQADAAAHAAALELSLGGANTPATVSTAVGRAQDYLDRNGAAPTSICTYSAAYPDADWDLHSGMLFGPNGGPYTDARICVRRESIVFFGKLLNGLVDRVHVSAAATAHFEEVPYGIMVMNDQGRCGAFSLSSNARVVLPGGIYVRSNCTTASRALSMEGNSEVVANVNHIRGGYRTVSLSSIVTTPVTNYDLLPDPLSGLPVPAIPSTPCITTTGGAFTPGVYCSRLILSSGIHNFASGVYVFLDGVEIDGTAQVNIAGGSLLYFTCPDYPASCDQAPGGSEPALRINSGGRLIFTGGGHPAYEQVGIWVDRTALSSKPTCSLAGGDSPGTVVFNGNARVEGAAIVYAINSTVELNSNAFSTLSIVADTLCMDSAAQIDVDPTAVSLGAAPSLQLVE